MLKLSTVIICNILLFLPVQKAHAWHSSWSLKDTVVVIAVAGVAIIVTPPAWLGYKTYKLVKDKTISAKNYFFSSSANEEAMSPEDAAEQIAKAQVFEATKSFIIQTNNLLSARIALQHAQDVAFLRKMMLYLERINRDLPSKEVHFGSLFCWFREAFFNDESKHIDPQSIKDWFLTYYRTSQIPDSYLTEAQVTFGLSDYAARYLFSRAYTSLTNSGFSFNENS